MDNYIWLTVLVLATAFQVHLRMRRSELEEYFGVSSYDKVPNYDVATPFQTDENGGFVSHELDLQTKHKRSTEEPNAWYLSIKVFGMSLHLNLTRNNEFLAPDLRIERHQNGTVTYEDVPQSSFLQGHVNSVLGSFVSISHDNGLAKLTSCSGAQLRPRSQTSINQPQSDWKTRHSLIQMTESQEIIFSRLDWWRTRMSSQHMALTEPKLDYGSSASNPSKLEALAQWTNINVPVSKRPDVMSLVSR
ncbi:hypothetical protein P5673_033553 [Acropora cervicornis]|uniref:Peptidase M12B propeptide domain-containing protein n=1 Tax=Acropora cervicornis TaxID=6130 RepID=A0AAD9UR96_ACRCE|nr:hypothetical protein P5673_033553 [Acropora cervicornis]